MPRWFRIALPALLLATAVAAGDVQAQFTVGVGGGIAQPLGDLDDAVDQGITGRAQLGMSFILASVHAQAGVTRFPGTNTSDDYTTSHVGVGGRLGLGLLFVGLNANYFFGDGEDGVGYVPEIGVGLLRLEVVADGRLDGDAKWVSLRAGLKF